MPIYEFICNDCNEEFEELILGSSPEIKCPKCSSQDCSKKVSAFAFKSGANFVGTGKRAASNCAGCSSTNCSSCGG